jgi:predicted NBD/HSP70 family sugar kinase
VALLYDLVDRLLQAASQPLLGIGIGAPGVIDAAGGVVLNAIRLDWHDLPLAALLSERYHLPVQIANDSQAAALAEYLFGGCHTEANLVAVHVGRGIGCGVVLEGQLYLGDSFSAGEIGHVRAVEDGELCRCGNHGCLETVASCTALLRAAQSAALSQPELYRASLLSRAGIPPEALTLEQLAQAYRSGDRLACQAAQAAAEHLGRAVAHLVSALNIHKVVITGEINALGAEFLQAVQQAAAQRILPAAAQRLTISSGCLEENVIILGACALLLIKELGLHPTRFPETANGRH